MEGKKPNLVLLFLLFAISFTFSNSVATETQTLVLHTLPNPPTLSWPESEALSVPESDLEPLSLQLHHIDALSSNKTSQQLFHLRLQRDAARVEAFTATITAAAAAPNNTHARRSGSGFSSSIISGLSQGSGEYFTRIGVGTPAKYLYMVLDTGSDVVWLQCAPCRKCYTQADPVFDPSKSRSFAGKTINLSVLLIFLNP